MRYYLTLFLILSIQVCFGQQKFFSELPISDDYNMLKTETKKHFVAQINTIDDSSLQSFLMQELEVDVIDESMVEEFFFPIKSVYNFKNLKRNYSKNVYVNLPNQRVYKIKNDKGEVYFHVKKGLFLIDEVKEDLIDQSIKDEIYRLDRDCITNAVHDSVFNKNMRVIKQAVILNSTDDATNNSAITFTNSNEDTKITAGFNFQYNNNHFLNVSIFTEADGGFIYSKGAWKNNTGASFTYNKAFGSSQKFDPKDCENLTKKRDKYFRSQIEKYFLDLKKLYAQKEQIEKELENNSNGLQYLKNRKILKEYKKEIENYESILKNPKKFVNDSIYNFDLTNDILYGGTVHWFKATGKIANQTINIPNDSIYTNKKITNYPSLDFNFSYNYNKIFKSDSYLNIQAFNSVNMGSFLLANLGDDDPILVNEDDTFFIYDSNSNSLGKYSDLKKAFWTNSTGFQASYIYKFIGLTGIYKHTFALQNEEFTNYKNRYTLQAGLILRPLKQDENAITIRLLAGVENSSYKDKILKDDFGVKLSVGIPFNLFVKK